MAYWEVLLTLRLLSLFYVRRWYSLFYVHLHYVNALVIGWLQAGSFGWCQDGVLVEVIPIKKSRLAG
jgi:hypothetical protein